jgi:hypothetical protein
MQLRSSWKLYSRIHKQLYDLLQKIDPNADPNLFGFDEGQIDEIVFDSTTEADKTAKEEDEALQEAIDEININENGSKISADGVKRLLAAVSYGYGMFQIFMSFMPPAYLKLFSLLGKFS